MLHVALGVWWLAWLLLRELVNVAGGPSLRYHWDDLHPESVDFMSMDLVHFIFDGASDLTKVGVCLATDRLLNPAYISLTRGK